MAVNAYFRTSTDKVVLPIGRGLARAGLTPNGITTLGLLGVILGITILLLGRPVLGGWIVAFATILDAFDGTVARLTDSQTEMGAFYDSVADRVADATIFAACAWVARDQPLVFTGVMIAFATALITSYIRAKAESLGFDATVGLIERPERVAIILPALGYGFLGWGAWLLAVGGAITIAQRLHAVMSQARERADERTSDER
ncbi:CDP-alcohol phosphatidyltransferase family protein [Euzebya tangerina]|uniref:CDP-alcohol phosphatidyltransferase family protein n=1 Tax=Euzebya tangerina TaxID=591198 RepID=UPI0013C2DC05|nr:CDP-alcohol phosphatidyltransferase family protein [Euzebya tangerina]